jgi:hypothetical protein
MAEADGVAAFLQGDGRDARGRTVFDVLSMNDADLERTHDFIQWLFPLPEPSMAVPEAPVLTEAEAEAIRTSTMAQCALAAATDRMAAFYALTTHWLAPHDHNHMRITRIIRSLRLLSGEEQADAFKSIIMARVEATRAPVNARSLGYWATA